MRPVRSRIRPRLALPAPTVPISCVAFRSIPLVVADPATAPLAGRQASGRLQSEVETRTPAVPADRLTVAPGGVATAPFPSAAKPAVRLSLPPDRRASPPSLRHSLPLPTTR